MNITGLISSLGRNPLTELLGGHPVIGGLVALLAGGLCLGWDYLRLSQGNRRFGSDLAIQRIGVAVAIISVLLMVSRFASVWAANGF